MLTNEVDGMMVLGIGAEEPTPIIYNSHDLGSLFPKTSAESLFQSPKRGANACQWLAQGHDVRPVVEGLTSRTSRNEWNI